MADPFLFFRELGASSLLQRSAIAGACAGLSCACLSPFVVLRRMSFVGDGMAHAAFGGLGVGLFLLAGSRTEDSGVQVIVLGFCLLVGLAVAWSTRRGEVAGSAGAAGERGGGALAEDSAIGMAFSVAMALGAWLITLRQRSDPQYTPSWEAYLFGSIATVGAGQVWLTVALAAVVLLALIVFYKEWELYTYDETLAEVSGLPASFLHYFFILLLVITVVATARVVGVVLVSASLILPGVAALSISRHLSRAVLLSALIGFLSFQGGLYVSYTWNVPPGSAVVLIQFAVTVFAMILGRLRGI